MQKLRPIGGDFGAIFVSVLAHKRMRAASWLLHFSVLKAAIAILSGAFAVQLKPKIEGLVRKHKAALP